MSKLAAVAFTVNSDEYALGLKEIVEQSPGSRGFHRYQVIAVVRADSPAEFTVDMGPVGLHRQDQFAIPCTFTDEHTGKREGLHTVAELQEMANQMRELPPLSWQQGPQEIELKLPSRE